MNTETDQEWTFPVYWRGVRVVYTAEGKVVYDSN